MIRTKRRISFKIMCEHCEKPVIITDRKNSTILAECNCCEEAEYEYSVFFNFKHLNKKAMVIDTTKIEVLDF